MYTPKLICTRYELPKNLQRVKVTKEGEKTFMAYDVFPDGTINIEIQESWYDEEFRELIWTGTEWVTNVPEYCHILKSALPKLNHIVEAHKNQTGA